MRAVIVATLIIKGSTVIMVAMTEKKEKTHTHATRRQCKNVRKTPTQHRPLTSNESSTETSNKHRETKLIDAGYIVIRDGEPIFSYLKKAL